MRTDEERLKFCGTITTAARRLGITARKNGDRFEFMDHVGMKVIIGCGNSDPKHALESACDELVEHLNKK